MIDQLRAMAIFREVAETGSFRGAAKTLKLSPSVVSHHVSQLEEQLGTALLYRSTRRISLTDDGHKLFAASQKLVAAANEGLSALHKSVEQPAGRLRIETIGNVFERSPHIDNLVAFARQHPKIELSISFSDRRADIFGSDCDVALRAGWLEDSQYKVRKLFNLKRVLIASPSYMAGRKTPKTADDLAELHWIKFSQLPINRQLTNSSGDMPKFNAKIAIEVDGVVPMCEMARNGMGLASVPRLQVEDDIKNGTLLEIFPAWNLSAVGVYAIWPNNVSQDSLSLRFVRFMAEQYGTSEPMAD